MARGRTYIWSPDVLPLPDGRYQMYFEKLTEQAGGESTAQLLVPYPMTVSSGSGNREFSRPDCGITYEIDLDFLEHAHREDLDQPELPWAPS